VVEDEQDIAALIKHALERSGDAQVDVVSSGDTALRAVADQAPDLVILDINLPVMSGIEVCRIMRSRAETAHTPIIMLTARTSESDRVAGLDLGADDYVTKPFSLEELVARIRTVLRRNADPVSRRLAVADLEMDEDTHEVWRGGEPVELSPTEFNLLRFLMLNPRSVVSKSQILSHVWRYDFRGDASVVETYVSYLRKKIDRGEPKLLHTVRGVGYTLRPPGG